MKIKMSSDADHRISSAVTQSFKADRTYPVRQETAEALVARGVAEVIGKKPSTEKEQNHGDG